MSALYVNRRPTGPLTPRGLFLLLATEASWAVVIVLACILWRLLS